MKVLGYAALIWFGVCWAYVAITHAKAVMERGELSLYWKVILLPLGIIGLALDFAFNLVFGTIMFREPPHEVLFTSRVKRHVLGSGRRQKLALWWKKQLNTFDPGHV